MKRTLTSATAALATAALCASLAATQPAAAAPTGPSHAKPKPQQTRLVDVSTVPFKSQASRRPATLAPSRWQAPTDGTASLTPGTAAQAGGYRVALGKGHGAANQDVSLERADGRVLVNLESGTKGSWQGPLTLTTDQLGPNSGDAESRLQVSDISGCATQDTACTGEPVPASADRSAGTLTFTATSGSTYSLASVAAGSAGSYSATGLSPASSWGANEQTGSFTWSYGINLPPSAAGTAPTVSIGYDSGSVDGRTASTNNQPSWVGEGFNLAPGGFITRDYASCADDMSGGTNASRKTGDLCWSKDNASIVLNGKASRLVRVGTTSTWRLKEDDRSLVTRATGAGNGDNDGEYWILTSTDGTKYYFGLEKRYSTDTTSRNATWTVPVNGNHSGEPCYNATFASGFCNQAWKWNLAYVKDVRGNTISYTYAKESNRYGQNLNTKSVTYDRGGYLTAIEYGQAAGSESSTNVQQAVLFDVAERCVPGGSVTCDPAQLTAANAAYWPDVPQDQICTSTTSCGTTRTTPTFFTRKMLTAVRTQVRKSGAMTNVARWDLTHSFPDPGDGTSASLQLDSIQQTGLAGGTATTPPVTFGRAQLQNRVDTGAADGDAPLIKWRVNAVHTETGGVISVNFKSPDCSTGSLPSAPDTNTRACYPSYWSPPGATTPVRGWFHKYLVDSVVADGGMGGSRATVTRYSYIGNPAWHYDDNITTPSKYRTWSEFRGFGTVDVITGDLDEPSPLRTRTVFYRGMNGDKLSSGTRTATVTDSTGATVTDSDWFNGLTRESITYNGTAEVDGTIITPWSSAATATDTYGSARIVRDSATVLTRTTRDSGAPRETRTVTTYDTAGNPTQVSDDGDTATTADNRCTTTTYVTNSTANLVGLPATSKTVAVGCGTTPTTGDITSETHTYYDNATTLTATPTRGEVTKTLMRADTGMVTSGTAAYDAIGRVTRTTNALNQPTATAYTPSDWQATTQTVVTDAKNFTTTTTIDPAYGLATKSVDTNSRATTLKYDPLGRLAKVWLPNRSTVQSPSMDYTYLVRNDGPTAVTTSTLHYLGTARITSTQLYDGLLRPVQTQTQSGSGNRVLTENIFDSRGLTTAVRGPWVTAGLPDATAVTAPDASIEKIVTTAYDGAARPTRAITWVYATEKQRTESTYHGDSVDVTTPAGGIATRSVTDARGRQTDLWQYHGSSVTTGKDVTHYAYDNKDRLTTVTNQAGTQWSYGYNQLGQQTTTTDPDKGTTLTEYDLLGNITKTTDAAGRVTTRDYDALGRPLTVKTGSGTMLAAWTYDTVTKGLGQLATATRTVDGGDYAYKVDSYDAMYNVTGNTVTIPATETGLTGDYTYTRGYNVDGSLGYVNMPAVGNLPAEQYAYQRDATNLPKNLLGQPNGVVADVSRDGYGRLTQYTIQAVDVGVHISTTWEDGLGRLATYRVDRDNVATPDQNATFTYDPSGRVTSIADTPDPATPARTDRQCFQYTWAGELTEAWANADTTCSATPSLKATGAAPYWTSWGYDAHRRATQTHHGTTTDTTTSYTYPALGATPGAGGNGGYHAVASTTRTVGTGAPVAATFTYDATGNTTNTPLPSGGTGTIAYDELGRTTTVTAAGATAGTRYVYDADGNLLIRRDPNGRKTLYLGDTEVTYTPAAGPNPATTTAVRLYTFDGQAVAIRNGAGTAGLVAQPPGYQGTSLTQVDGAGTNYATRRYDPFGNTRGATATTWIGDHGFLGGTGATKAGNGLIHLGAREYDPTTGRFTSVDPVMDLLDPTQWNAYSYAQNNPVTLSDPDGNRPIGPGDEGCNNCRLKTVKTKSGKTKYTWTFGNEPYTATVGVQQVKAPSRAVYQAALYKAKVAATKRTYFFGLIHANAPMSTYDTAANCNAGAALSGSCSQGDLMEGVVLTEYLCAESGISCNVDGGGTSVGAILASGAAGFGMGGGGRLGGNIGAGLGGAGIDRGDGRDARGRFTGKGGYGAEAEAQGLRNYARVEGRSVDSTRVRATLPDGSQRYYDGLSKQPGSGSTYEGVEVKTGNTPLTAGQSAFDAQVRAGTPATAMLNGQEISITSTALVRVR